MKVLKKVVTNLREDFGLLNKNKNTLHVQKHTAGKWIGKGGSEIKRIAQEEGSRFIKVEEDLEIKSFQMFRKKCYINGKLVGTIEDNSYFKVWDEAKEREREEKERKEKEEEEKEEAQKKEIGKALLNEEVDFLRMDTCKMEKDEKGLEFPEGTPEKVKEYMLKNNLNYIHLFGEKKMEGGVEKISAEVRRAYGYWNHNCDKEECIKYKDTVKCEKRVWEIMEAKIYKHKFFEKDTPDNEMCLWFH